MDKKILNTSTKGGLLIAILLVVVDYRITLGMILGLMFYRLYYMLLTMSIEDQIDVPSEVRARNIGAVALRLLLLAFPMLVCFVIPDVFNIWGVFSGLMAFKITVYIYSIFNR
ncbi:MAG: hypothetical protein IJJ19_04185 [Erysipelotrichaceae bacterium]|nr:hypothetical protein [Erysipelotrichaceae bacterium]